MIDEHTYSRLVYSEIYSVNGPDFCPPLYAQEIPIISTDHYFREDTIAKKVYLRDLDGGAERIYYDFSLQVGDTIPAYFDDEQEATVVLSVDSVQLDNGEYRTRWNFVTFGIEHWYAEGVGSYFGPLHMFMPNFSGGDRLWCHRHMEVLLQIHYCTDLSVGVDDPQVDRPADLPFELIFYRDAIQLIMKEEGSKGTFMIRSSDGKEIQRVDLFGEQVKDVPIRSLAPGIYIYSFVDEEGRIWSKRSLKEE